MYLSNHVLKKVFLVMITITVAYFFAAPQQTAFAQSEKEIKAKVEESLNIWNKGDLSLVDKLYSPDIIRHNVDINDDIVGAKAFKEYVTSLRTAYPDFNVKFEELIIKDLTGVVRWTITGTNTGPLGDLPATGKKMKISGVTIWKYVDGKVAEEWVY